MKNQIISVTILLVLISTINAFGISSPYWEDNPLTIEQGETKIVNLNAQNMVGGEDIKIKAEVIEGSEILSLEQDTFLIQKWTSDTTIPVKVTIPKNAPEENKTVKIEFKKIIEQTEGIPLGTGMAISFNVITTNKNHNSINKKITIIITIIMVALLTILFAGLRKRKNKILNS